MGFFSKLKAVKNVMTGGAAKVYFDSEPLRYNEPFTITVRAEIDDADIDCDRVYLKIKGAEEIEVQDVDVIYDRDGDVDRRVETIHAQHKTVEMELTVASGQKLEANQSYEWQIQVELPSNAPNIYRGRHCQHTYYAFAGLDCFGNDPDSGWLELYD
ncbi:hypothetical protein C2869_09515 [Saccharobesus litoralis]|uniref:Uncharacterized protein n=1 Tax=Saccharobesus litoralis TaxID=2172099 RepID=A0A2S0VR06_9ALTE|nr:hypothetical protein [Saccharobesus litoralis]AWB66655.1 hypothetical protein C2869_09515 [Saccharobesus litoralis]